MTSSQKDLLRVALETESVTREKELAYQDGYMLMSDTDYYVYMHQRTGWGRRKIQRDFEVKLAIKGAVKKKISGTWRLGVAKTPEITRTDALKLSQK